MYKKYNLKVIKVDIMIDNYDYFLEILEIGSISKAAKKLYISQPALSKYLRHLEEALGAKIFNRTSPLTLTKAGELYYEYVKHSKYKELELKNNINKLNSDYSGEVRLGITSWRSQILLPLFLNDFTDKYPNIKVTVEEDSHKGLNQMLNSGMIDFCIAHNPSRFFKNNHFRHLMNEKIYLCVNKKNPILNNINYDKKSKEISYISSYEFMKLINCKFILLKKNQNLREIVDRYINKYNLNLDNYIELSNIQTSIEIVNRSNYITFAPSNIENFKNITHNLLMFSLDKPELQWEIGIFTRKEQTNDVLVELLIEYIKSSLNI